jgi:Na+-transporting NADH:ubiquinone oxidoreductase subunit D
MSEKVKEPLFSKKNKKLVTDPLSENNPVTVQVLGICSALAITVSIEQAVVMSASVLFVVALGNVVVSMMRNLIPDRIRIIVQLVAAASLVIIVDQILKAFVPDVAAKLSVFVGLIITNCILMGRYEAFAMGNKPWPSFLDGIGNSLGYAWILIVVSVFRELFGTGKLMGIEIFGNAIDKTGMYGMGYMNNNLIILAPFALFCVAIVIWVQRSINKNLIEH